MNLAQHSMKLLHVAFTHFLHCKNVRVISTLAGLHLFRGFYSLHVRVISTLPGYILTVADVSIMAQLANLN